MKIPQEPSAAASKGTLVHAALELLMQREPDHRTLQNALSDLDTARKKLASDPDFTGLDLTATEWDKFHADAAALVHKYFELEDPKTIRPVGLEMRVSAQIGNVRLRGIIDRLELDNNDDLVITDYKTGRAPPARFAEKRMDGVHIYAALVEAEQGKRPVRAQLLFLADPVAVVTNISQQTITRVERSTNAVWSAIQTATEKDDFRPSTSKLCDYCSYQAYCPEFGGNPEAALALLNPPVTGATRPTLATPGQAS